MYYTYVLQSEQDYTYYIGYCSDLEKRLEDHNRGKTKSIKHKLPLKLIYYEGYPNKRHAIMRENQLKKNRREKEKILERLNW